MALDKMIISDDRPRVDKRARLLARRRPRLLYYLSRFSVTGTNVIVGVLIVRRSLVRPRERTRTAGRM